MQKITPFLWYSKEAEQAAAFWASIFPDSRVTRVTTLPSESPSGPPGSVKVVEFVLFGQPFIAMSAGPLDPFNHAVSFVVNCDDQAELDRYWNALLEGGSAEQCGWLKDRFGLSWQIVPTVLGEMMAEPDRAKAKRASDAMMVGNSRSAACSLRHSRVHRVGMSNQRKRSARPHSLTASSDVGLARARAAANRSGCSGRSAVFRGCRATRLPDRDR
jgi:predicted 3-demethylubiquinone-9 3-methyltransferase (glyoxalase superfamily)